MSKKGILYLMTTSHPGIIKIGKTEEYQFEKRMKYLEQNGYSQFNGLHREFAILVDDYDNKEQLLHQIFDKSRIANTEFFAVKINLVKKLLSAFAGEQIYPKDEVEGLQSRIQNTNQSFRKSVINKNFGLPEGLYHTVSKKYYGIMEYKNGGYILKKGTVISPLSYGARRNQINYSMDRNKLLNLKDDDSIILNEDLIFGNDTSTSFLGFLVSGRSTNGWTFWFDDKNEPIDKYRK